ncbi:hypothetical protein LINPERPRIM_LOCUS36597 [Linum perenne]
MVGGSIPLTSYGAETGKSSFPTHFVKATLLLIYLSTMGTTSILAFILIVCTPTR